MKIHLYVILIIGIHSVAYLQAQDSVSRTTQYLSRTCLQIDSVSFNDSIVLSQLRRQTDCRIVDCRKSTGDTLAGYWIVGYKFSYLSKKLGYGETIITGKSLAGIHKYLMQLEPGDFVMFSEIQGIRPGPDKDKNEIFYLANLAGTLK